MRYHATYPSTFLTYLYFNNVLCLLHRKKSLLMKFKLTNRKRTDGKRARGRSATAPRVARQREIEREKRTRKFMDKSVWETLTDGDLDNN